MSKRIPYQTLDAAERPTEAPGEALFKFSTASCRLAALVFACFLLVLPPGVPRHAAPARLRAPSFARHAILLCGEVRTLREGLSSQLALLAATEGGVDIYAVLSPTTKHQTRPGVAPNATADAAQLEWLRALPSLRALRQVPTNHHDAFIERDLPGFPWTDEEYWIYFQPRNVVAMFLKRKLAWQLMEDTLRDAGAAAHRYDTIVVARGDLVARATQRRWPRGLDLNEFSLTGYMRGLAGRAFVPGQPDSWAPEEGAERALRPMPHVFVNSITYGNGASVQISDMFAIGDWTAMAYYCHAVDFMRRLCSEEKGGPNHESPVQLNPSALLAAGAISGAREATRRARESDALAPARGIRFAELHVDFCLGQETGSFSLENKLSGCFDN
jgi:hypothetical protein